MLAPFIAEELEIPKIIVPIIPPGNFSAWGLLMSDLKHDVVKTTIARLDSPRIQTIFNEGFEELASQVISLLKVKTSGADLILTRSADLRYYGQEHTIRVQVIARRIAAKEVTDTAAAFRNQHQRQTMQ